MSSPLDQADLRQRVQACIDAELTHQRAVLAEIGPDVEDLLGAIGQLLTGGKRLRAAFLYWGHRAAGRPDSDAAAGDVVTLFGAAAGEPTAQQWADATGTISYEIVTRLGARVPRIAHGARVAAR